MLSTHVNIFLLFLTHTLRYVSCFGNAQGKHRCSLRDCQAWSALLANRFDRCSATLNQGDLVW